MEENHRLIAASIALSVVFNVLSWAILTGMNNRDFFEDGNVALWWDEFTHPCEKRNTNKGNATERKLGPINLLIGLGALACWITSLTLNSSGDGLTSSNPTIQTWYGVGTAFAILVIIWMLMSIKYWRIFR